jgi:hypothetical protein
MDVEQRLAVQEALVSALIAHAANRGMIADMLFDAKARLGATDNPGERAISAGVIGQLEAILGQLDTRPAAARRR